MTCSELARLQTAFLALELDAESEAAVRAHLRACDPCRAAVSSAEPAVGLALGLAMREVAADPTFAGEVLAGVHQRAVERRLTRRRRRWMAVAAGVLLAVAGGWAALRRGHQPAAMEAAARVVPATVEPAFVEVEGSGVRLYQFDSPSQEPVRVAFIVDPQLEL